jgi:DNA-binding transcriptional regulator YhcF (GntR family)
MTAPDDLDRPPETPVYQQIADHYAAQIHTGQLKPGERLPSVDNLCGTWKVAVQTAVRAVHALKAGGLVTTSPRGTFVSDMTDGRRAGRPKPQDPRPK